MEKETGKYVGTALHHGAKIVAWSTRDAVSNSAVTTDAIHYDAKSNTLTLTGEDVFRTGRRLGVYSDSEAQRFIREERAKDKEYDDGMTASPREPSVVALDEDDGLVLDGRIMTLAEWNRRNRAKQSKRAVRDHDLRHAAVLTLHDINLLNRYRAGRSA